MTQPRTFSVRFIPARDEGTCISTLPFDTLHKTEIAASSVPELVQKVAAAAKTLGKPCQAYVSVRDGGRKPKGFDAATNRLYYNLDAEPTEPHAPHVTLSEYASSL